MSAFVDDLFHRALRSAIGLSQHRRYRHLLQSATDPRSAQSDVLRTVLAKNEATEFGAAHQFDTIRGQDEYRRAVPVQSYEDLRPLIECQELTGRPCLTIERPVYFNRTSGTVARPKHIPLTAGGLRRIRGFQRLSAYNQSRKSDVFRGRVFGITGAAVEGRMDGGTPYGSASGLLYENQSRFVKSRYVLPNWVSKIEDYDTRYLVMATLGVAERDVSGVATANPSTLVRLLATINDNVDTILRAVATGVLPDQEILASSQGVRPKVLCANPRRARSLTRLAERSGSLSYADIWPDLAGLATWTAGSCGVPLHSLRDSLPVQTKVIELGYVSSEFHSTLNVDIERNVCLPTLNDGVFEFVERRKREQGKADFLGLHEIQDDEEYYIFITTPEGLYRYDMNDIVRVTGRVANTPTLTFVQKGQGVTSITGEKLHENQALDAVAALLKDHNIRSHFFVMLADQSEASYTLFIEMLDCESDHGEELALELDARLRTLNIEYGSKRDSGRLAPTRIRILREGSADAYRRDRVAHGQRDAQFKFLHLQYAHECRFDFDAHTQDQGAQ